MTIPQLLLALLILTLTACSSISPSGFWTDFRPDYQISKHCDQGPYGGRRTIHWKSDVRDFFSTSEILDFAQKNGWTLVDTQLLNSEQMKSWSINDTLIFPLYLNGIYAMYSDDNLGSWTTFFRKIEADVTVFRFETSWLLFYPGTDESTEENGYVMVSEDGRQLSVYHLWSE